MTLRRLTDMTTADVKRMARRMALSIETVDGKDYLVDPSGKRTPLDNIQVIEGPPGDSAYEVYAQAEQDAGRAPLSIDAWNKAHFGEDGYTPQKGVDYDDGKDGLSAYQLARQEGYGGTLTQWLASLSGDDGFTPKPNWSGTALSFTQPDGGTTAPIDLKGEPGYTPKKGTDYDDGQRGPMPDHRWYGTKLAFQKPSGGYSAAVDVKGPPGADATTPIYDANGNQWQGVITRIYNVTTNRNGQWAVNYEPAGFTDEPIVDPVAWHESSNAADQAIVTGGQRTRHYATGRVVRGVSGSLLGLSSTWRFADAGVPVTVRVTGPTK